MSQPLSTRLVRSSALAALACGALFAGTASAAESAASSSDARYQRERAACDSGRSNQDRATCLKEAGAAKADAKRGVLADGASPQTREVNAIARCKALPAKDQTDCMARIDGPSGPNARTMTSGSVGGGGILRETVTTVPGKSGATMPSASTPH